AACGSASGPPPSAAPSETTVRSALAGRVRTDRERARDGYRHPAETLAFFGLKDDLNVVELWPGRGYYTASLAPTLAPRGKLAVTHFDPNGDPKSEDTKEAQLILKRLDEDAQTFGKIDRRQISVSDLSLGPDGSADMVLTFRNVHNWIE